VIESNKQAIYDAIESGRAKAQAAGHDLTGQTSRGATEILEAISDELTVTNVPAAIAALAATVGRIEVALDEFRLLADGVLQALEGLKGTAVPTEELLRLGLGAIVDPPAVEPETQAAAAAAPVPVEESPETD